MALGAAPGAYAGAVILLAVPAAIRARQRFVTAAFGVTGAVSYVLTLNALVGAQWFRSFALNLPFGDVYLHNVNRLRYLLLLVVPVLGALGIQGFLERPPPVKRALAWVGAGVALWLVVPVAVGAHPVRFVLLAIAAAAAVPALAWLGRHRRAGLVVVAVLALELVGSAAYSQSYDGGTVFLGLEPNTLGANLIPQPLRWPRVSLDAYTRAGPIALRIEASPSRYFTWDPPEAYIDKGYLYEQGRSTWPALENARGMLFGLPDSMGYSPVQLTRYWSWIRAVNPTPVFYNASVLHHPTVQDLQMLAVRYFIAPGSDVPPVPASPLVREGRYVLYAARDATSLVTATTGWRLVPDGAAALRAVTDTTFDPTGPVVLQGVHGLGVGERGAAPRISWSEPSPEHLRIEVSSKEPAVVLVRNSFDPDWSASVDGGPAVKALAADYLLQAVPIAAGRHVVDLRYRDPKIGEGLLASAIVWGLFGAVLLVVAARRRPRRRGMPAPA